MKLSSQEDSAFFGTQYTMGFTALYLYRAVLTMSKMSVRLSPSVKRVNCDKTKEKNFC